MDDEGPEDDSKQMVDPPAEGPRRQGYSSKSSYFDYSLFASGLEAASSYPVAHHTRLTNQGYGWNVSVLPLICRP